MSMLLEKPVAAINIVIDRPAIGYYREKDRVIEILDEHVLRQNGCYRYVRRWLRGIHPERGQIIQGLTGWETVEEKSVIKAMGTVDVLDTPESLDRVNHV